MPFSLTLTHTLPDHSYPVALISIIPVQVCLLDSETICSTTYWTSLLEFSTHLRCMSKTLLIVSPTDVDHLLCTSAQGKALPSIQSGKQEISESFLTLSHTQSITKSYLYSESVVHFFPPSGEDNATIKSIGEITVGEFWFCFYCYMAPDKLFYFSLPQM